MGERPDEPNLSAVAMTGPRRGDAFGAILLACLERSAAPGAVLEIIERDDGFIEAMDAARYFTGPEDWGHLGRWACAQARGRVLDIGCGAGRHALYLQGKGHEVVGLDISPLAIEVCRRRGLRQAAVGTVADLVQAGAGPFDSFLMMGNNLGLLGGAEQAPRLLADLAALAAPDAVIVGQGTDPYQTSNPVHLAYHQRNRALGRMGGQARLRVRDLDVATDWFDYLFVSVDELAKLLAGTAWRLEQVEAEGASYVAVLRR